MSDFKERVQKRVEEILPELIGLSNTVWEHPEYNFEEFHACKSMSELLKKFGFEVTTGVGGSDLRKGCIRHRKRRTQYRYLRGVRRCSRNGSFLRT